MDRRLARVLVPLLATLMSVGGVAAMQEGSPTPAVTSDIFDPVVAAATPISGVETFSVSSAEHRTEPVDYPQDPPAGGPHAPVWQKCQVYDAPVQNETAVHSQEHGAVWITYQPDLPKADIEALAALAKDQRFVLVSPYPDLTSPVVASAWGAQLRLDDPGDPRLAEFIARYAGNGPEPGASCDSGVETTLEG